MSACIRKAICSQNRNDKLVTNKLPRRTPSTTTEYAATFETFVRSPTRE